MSERKIYVFNNETPKIFSELKLRYTLNPDYLLIDEAGGLPYFDKNNLLIPMICSGICSGEEFVLYTGDKFYINGGKIIKDNNMILKKKKTRLYVVKGIADTKENPVISLFINHDNLITCIDILKKESDEVYHVIHHDANGNIHRFKHFLPQVCIFVLDILRKYADGYVVTYEHNTMNHEFLDKILNTMYNEDNKLIIGAVSISNIIQMMKGSADDDLIKYEIIKQEFYNKTDSLSIFARLVWICEKLELLGKRF